MSDYKKRNKWVPSDSHESESIKGKKHFDVDKYDDKGNIDKGSGKLHISGEKHEPSMKDVHPSKKE